MALAAIVAAHIVAYVVVQGTPGGEQRVLADGAAAWTDESTWHNTPSWLSGTAVTVAPYLVGGTPVGIVCYSMSPCEAVVFQYRCTSCGMSNGQIPMSLAALGWEVTRCTPSFSLTDNGFRHPMIGFRKTLAAGEVVQLVLEGEAEFTAFAVQYTTADCEAQVDEGGCAATGAGACAFLDEACQANRCLPTAPFVGPVMNECAEECVVSLRPSEIELARLQYPVYYDSPLPGVPALAASPPLREAPLNTWLASFAGRALTNEYFDRQSPTAELIEILTNPSRTDLQKLKLIKAAAALFVASTYNRTLDGPRAQSLDELLDVIPDSIADGVTALHETKSDPAFARYRLSGYVPFTLRKCNQQLVYDMDLHSYTGVSSTLIERVQAAMDTGRLFAVDFGNVNTSQAQDGMYLSNPVALFEIPTDTDTRDREGLQVLCVQVFKGKVKSIATPEDNEFAWTYAKNLFNSVEANYHESVHHLGETHMMVGAISISIRRSLPAAHPVHQLMNSFIDGTILINWLGNASLVNPEGPVDRLFTTKLDDWNQAAADAMFSRASKNFTFPAIMQETGLTEDEFPTTYYPYREFAGKIWNAQHAYAREYIEAYYSSDAAVDQDEDLSRFRDELVANGIGWVADAWVLGHGSVDFLVDFLAATMFFGSVQHATVGRPQGSIVATANVCPLAWVAEIPEDITTITTEADVLATFADLPALFYQRDVMHVLAMTFNTFTSFDTEQFDDAAARQAATTFVASLDEAEAAMTARNEYWVSLWSDISTAVPSDQFDHWAYTDLLPSRLTVSINI